MPAIVGEKLKLQNAIDGSMADDITPLYSVELALSKSEKGMKCGAIVVFKLNQVDLTLPERLSPEDIRAIQSDVNKQTEVMYKDPEYFRESEGRWLPWAFERVLQVFDGLGGNARLAIKCARLKVHAKIPRWKVNRDRSDPRALFRVALEIDRLLDGNFNYDPWTRKIRRGRISAAMSRR